jgi:hypothetical protein
LPLESWIQHSRLDQFLYDWQTFIAGVFALVAAFGTIVVTRRLANRQIEESRAQVRGVIDAARAQTDATDQQTTWTLRMQRDRDASEARAFLVMLEAAMARVLAEVTWARENYPVTLEQTIGESSDSFVVRHCITKGAFAELRATCVRQGSPLTGDFLDLERVIDSFAMQVGTYSFSAASTMQVQKGKHAGLGEQLAVIETKATALRQKAVEAIVKKI